MTNEIKPCPFCGSQPVYHDEYFMCHGVGCPICGITMTHIDWNCRAIEPETELPTKTLRDEFAMATLTGLYANPECNLHEAECAGSCFSMADEMMKARNARSE